MRWVSRDNARNESPSACEPLCSREAVSREIGVGEHVGTVVGFVFLGLVVLLIDSLSYMASLVVVGLVDVVGLTVCKILVGFLVGLLLTLLLTLLLGVGRVIGLDDAVLTAFVCFVALGLLIYLVALLRNHEGGVVVGLVASLKGISMANTSPSYRKSRVAETKRRALQQAQTLLNLAELVLPRKITGECFGDRSEALDEIAETSSHWRLQLEALISIGWAVLFTLREIAKPGALIAAIWRLLFGSPLN